MKKQVLVVAPHPDDETLGCGGTLLRHQAKGDEIHWLVVTAMTQEGGYSAERITKRTAEIEKVAKEFKFASTHQLGFSTCTLDSTPLSKIVDSMSNVFKKVQPNVVYASFPGDVHSDHAVVFNAVSACSKWFRYPFVQKLAVYEAISETDFCTNLEVPGFTPNLFVDISPYLEKKIALLKNYTGELGEFPFPRSEEAIRALAKVRGATAGFHAAEAFMVVRERES